MEFITFRFIKNHCLFVLSITSKSNPVFQKGHILTVKFDNAIYISSVISELQTEFISYLTLLVLCAYTAGLN